MTHPNPILAWAEQLITTMEANRMDGPAAEAENRCAVPPLGCGQPLPGEPDDVFRNQTSRREYDITHLCQDCQDRVFGALSEER